MTLGHDSELADVVDSFPGNEGAKHPFGHAVVTGAMEDGPGSSDSGHAEKAGGNLTTDAGADEWFRDGIVFATSSLVEDAGGDAVGGDFCDENGELNLRLAGHWRFWEFYFLGEGCAQQD
jgi:hypothetical protein